MALTWASHLCRAQIQRSLRSAKTLAPTIIQKTTPSSFLLTNQQLVSTGKNCCAQSGHAAHNHTPIWTAERVLSAGLLGILPAAFAFPNTALEYMAAVALTAHVHWGIEAIVVDYLRPAVVGPALAKVALASVYLLSILTLGGLFYFNYNDVGLMQAIRMLWKL